MNSVVSLSDNAASLIAIAILFIGLPLSVGAAIGFVIWLFMRWDTK
jgi:hypothetical protein